MKTYEVYSLENNLASMQTTVRFRVWETLDEMDRMVDECRVTLQGRYDIIEDGLMEAVEEIYTTEVPDA
jgi:hypothetical protein|tara:strand:- start:383 stop:589 length:207 start_codon:yes stop_codon:yes gene_type:complete